MLNWYKAEGSEYPQKINDTISKKYIYVRVNPIKKDSGLWQYEEAIIQKEELENNSEVIYKEIEAKENSIEAIMEALADALVQAKLKAPKARKKGYKLVLKYEDGGLFWTYEPTGEPFPGGSYLNPVEWAPGMQVIAGIEPEYEADGWYIYDDLVQRCIKSGYPLNFLDKEYWEVVE